MTEIITDYLDAKQLADRLTALELRSTSELARLEQERDEAREDLEEETKFHHRTHIELIQTQCKLLDMEMQRDEARKKVEQQRKEIVRLNGATNHAGGTPLKIALRERDEALSQIVQAECRAERFCQERDEAREALASRKVVIAQQNVITDLLLERDEAVEEIKEWKTLCLWGGTPEHIHGFISGQQSRIQHLERERDEARAALMKIEDLFIDGTDIYADRENMGLIARSALEEAK
jgi:hypothetical protein